MSIVEGELTSVALCWRVERQDGAGIALTSHDSRVTREGVVYETSPGIMPAAVTRGLGLDPRGGEVAGAISGEGIDELDLALGRWDGAVVRLTAVDWDAGGEAIALVAGEIGAVSISGRSYSAELRGAATKLDAPVCPATSAECRAEFGDKNCRVDLAGRMTRATVLGSSAGELTLDRPLDDRFVLGRLRYMSGANTGVTTIVLSVDGATVGIRDLPRAAVEDGCVVEVREGCDKRFQTCKQRFANAVNFRGEPYLPGNDLLTRYPGV